jgi:tRNA nucleotidyltransferase (CCA-adding enzyme)
MHMPGAAADRAIVNPPEAAPLAWQRLQPEGWPLPRQAFPEGSALVGGAVRDALLDRLGPAPDLDLVVVGDAIALCHQLSRRHGGTAVVLDHERSIARLVIQGWSVDLARREGPSLESDLHRRDYTVNAMALPLAQPSQLVDPLHGLGHLGQGLLVAVAERNLLDDPLRLLRGLRLASELGFELDPQTQHWIEQHHQTMATVAGERVLAELEKLASAPTGERELALCLHLGLLNPWRNTITLQEEETGASLLGGCSQHSATALGLSEAEQAQALPLARLAAALDGPSLLQLRSSRKLQQRLSALRRWQQQLGATAPATAAEALPEEERLQLHRDLEADLPALLLGWPEAIAQQWLERWRQSDDPLFHPRPAIDGSSLQRELGIPASPALGKLLQHLMREQAFGRLEGRSDALQIARDWLRSAERCSERAPRRD